MNVFVMTEIPEFSENKSSMQVDNILETGQELEYELLDVEDEKFYRGNVIKNKQKLVIFVKYPFKSEF